MDKCPYCSAETRPGDNFCLNCGNRLVPSTPSPQQAQPVFGDATIPASEDWVPPGQEAAPSAQESGWRDYDNLVNIANTSLEPTASPADTSASSSSTAPVAHDILDKVEHPAHLILRAATGEVLQEYSLVKTQTSIGRAPTSDILLSKDKLTSRRHATIRYENGNYVLVDERSADGTFVNGQQLEEMTPRTLHDGDHIGIGEHELVFQAYKPASSSAVDTSAASSSTAPVAQAIMDKVEHPAHLILRTDTGEVLQEYSLEKTQTSIGRAPTSDILLSKDKLTSRRHATIRYENGNYVLVDERSANGTFVNGQQLEEMTPRTLHDGDHIGIGEHELVFQAYQSESAGVDIESMSTITVSPSAIADITYRTRDDELLTAAAEDDISTRSMHGGDSASSRGTTDLDETAVNILEREAGLKAIVNDQNGLLEHARVNTIYLSSTYSDLKECREAVYLALRRMRYDVIAMEDYVATDQRPLEKCLADVAICDLYIGILAWQYGYVPPEGNPDQKSITELEYRKARELGKFCLLYFLDEKSPWLSEAMDAVTGKGERGERISTLRQELQREVIIAFFSSPEDLARKISVDVERLNLQLSSERANREASLRAMLADHTGFLYDRLESFVGRQAELAEIRQRIAEKLRTGGFITITGQAGQGKSSMIAKLVDEYGPENVAYHFIPINPGRDYQVTLLQSLMARLILKYDLSDLNVASKSLPVLRNYFSQVLADLIAKGVRGETIFIDGLDQLEEEVNGFRDLSFLPNNPPTGIVFVLSTRPNDTLRPLELLKPLYEYKLPNLSREDFDLILENRNVKLNKEFTDLLYRVMDGNAHYLDLTAKAAMAKTDLLGPTEWTVLNAVVLVLAQAQNWEKALSVAQLIEPDVPRDYALRNIALSLAQAGEFGRASTVAEAITSSQAKAATILSLAHELILFGQVEQAFALLDNSLRLAHTIEQIEDRTAILQSVADELITLEQKEQAVSILKEALADGNLISNTDTRSKAMISTIALVSKLDSNYAGAILEAYREDQDSRVRQAVSQILEQAAEIATDIRTAIVRILDKSQHLIGAGLLVDNSHIVTCATVISLALGLDLYTQEKPIDQVYLDFPFIALDQILTANVIFWQPPPLNNEENDIAGLQLVGNLPKGAQAAPLIISEDLQGHTFRALGFPRHFYSGLWASGVLMGHLANGLVQARSEEITAGYGGAAVWDNELNGVVGIVDSFTVGSESHLAFIRSTNALIEAWPMLSQYAMPPCPYRGLSAFREQDAPYFFGRESFTTQLFQAMRRQPLIAVIGPPGSGKSSVVFAGLIPRLRQEGSHLIISFRPGDRPFGALATAIISLLEPKMTETDRLLEAQKLAKQLEIGELTIRNLLIRVMESYTSTQLFLVADQFEELFTLCRDFQLRQHFLDQIIETTRLQGNVWFSLIITMRTEFLGQALSYRPFADSLQSATFTLGQMTPQELLDAIEQPAQKLNIKFEVGLRESIIDDVAERSHYLPITEYIMTQLWKTQRNRILTLAAYVEIGDVEEVVERYFLRATNLPTPNAYHLGISITPSQVSVGQLVHVYVELLPVVSSDNKTFVLLPDVAEIHCFISADGFEVRGPEVVKMVVHPRTKDLTPAHFELQARLRGSRQCTIELFVEDSQSSQIHIFQSREIVTVIAPSAIEERMPILPDLDVRVPQAGFILEVQTQSLFDESLYELTFHLTCRLPGLQIRNQRVGSVGMSVTHLSRLWIMVAEAVQASTNIHPDDARTCMLALGTYLFDQIFPAEETSAFRNLFWQASIQASNWDWLFIHDESIWLPWELIVPYRENDNTPLSFLCERFRVGQWVDGLGPKLYKEIPYGELALAHYKNIERGMEDRDDELLAWRKLLHAYGAYGILQVVKPETPIYELHLLRHVEQITRTEIVVRDASAKDFSMEEAHQARLNLRLKRPLVTLSILDEFGLVLRGNMENWMLPERVMPFLRAGASAVIGPLWPTCEEADGTFWSTFYDLLEQHASVGEAVWRSRQEVKRILPHRPDWLAYSLFGNPLAKPYWPKESDGYATLECLSSDDPLRPGKTYTFLASISSRPPVGYQDRLVRTERLPDQVQALFIAPRLQEVPPEPVPMQQVGRTILQAAIDLTPPTPGKYPLFVQLLQGDEQLRTLQLVLDVETVSMGDQFNE